MKFAFIFIITFFIPVTCLKFNSRGLNPSEEQVQDIINEVDMDGSGKVEWPEFAAVLARMLKADEDEEENYKETFRVFSKDEQGCIPAPEMKFILSQICSVEVLTLHCTLT